MHKPRNPVGRPKGRKDTVPRTITSAALIAAQFKTDTPSVRTEPIAGRVTPHVKKLLQGIRPASLNWGERIEKMAREWETGKDSPNDGSGIDF